MRPLSLNYIVYERESLAMSKALSLKTKEKDSIFSRNSRSPLWEPNK